MPGDNNNHHQNNNNNNGGNDDDNNQGPNNNNNNNNNGNNNNNNNNDNNNDNNDNNNGGDDGDDEQGGNHGGGGPHNPDDDDDMNPGGGQGGNQEPMEVEDQDDKSSESSYESQVNLLDRPSESDSPDEGSGSDSDQDMPEFIPEMQQSADPSRWKDIDVTAGPSREEEHQNVTPQVVEESLVSGFDISGVISAMTEQPSRAAIPYSSRVPSRDINVNYFLGKRLVRVTIDANAELFKDDDSEDDADWDVTRDRSYVKQRDVGDIRYSWNARTDELRVYSVGPTPRFMEHYRQPNHTRYVEMRSSIFIVDRLGPPIRRYVIDDEELKYVDTFKPRSGPSGAPDFYYNPTWEYSSARDIEEYAHVAEPGSSVTVTNALRKFFVNTRTERKRELQRITSLFCLGIRVARILGPGRFTFVRHPGRHSPLLTEEDVAVMENVVDGIHTIEKLAEITADSMEQDDPISKTASEVIEMIVSDDERPTEEPISKVPLERTTSTPMPPPPGPQRTPKPVDQPEFSPIVTRSRSRRRSNKKKKKSTPKTKPKTTE